MLFNSYTFIIFFALVLALHYAPFPWRVKKFNLLIASYLFYVAWNPPFVLLLWLSTIVDWFVARWMAKTESRGGRRLALLVSLGVNLGLLGYFKYGQFLLDNFVTMAGMVGIAYQPPDFQIILPVGISFYTFQTLSYSIDVYRGNARPWSSFLDFALYVTFFPQLVAGPIVRATGFLPQCLTPVRASGRNFAWGLNLLLLGLFEKIVVADGLLAPVVDEAFAVRSIDTILAWVGALAFAGQIFCDFAGYSTCAIGVAMCLGFALPDNFRFPYAAIGFSDFWRRWHISLSTWLRDYLYIPLGGNRGRTHVNLMLTMLLGGLWHGASWTFVAWGGLHGLFLVGERGLRRTPAADWPFWRSYLGKFFLAALTFGLVCIAWVFFRAESFSQAWAFLNAMLFKPGYGETQQVLSSLRVMSVLGVVGVLLLVHWTLRDTTLEDAANKLPHLGLAALNTAMIVTIIMMPGEDHAFIYFQF